MAEAHIADKNIKRPHDTKSCGRLMSVFYTVYLSSAMAKFASSDDPAT